MKPKVNIITFTGIIPQKRECTSCKNLRKPLYVFNKERDTKFKPMHLCLFCVEKKDLEKLARLSLQDSQNKDNHAQGE